MKILRTLRDWGFPFFQSVNKREKILKAETCENISFPHERLLIINIYIGENWKRVVYLRFRPFRSKIQFVNAALSVKNVRKNSPLEATCEWIVTVVSRNIHQHRCLRNCPEEFRRRKNYSSEAWQIKRKKRVASRPEKFHNRKLMNKEIYRGVEMNFKEMRYFVQTISNLFRQQLRSSLSALRLGSFFRSWIINLLKTFREFNSN